MSNYDPDYSEKDTKKRHKSPKFRDYYDDEFNEEDEKEMYKRKNKLGKSPKEKRIPIMTGLNNLLLSHPSGWFQPQNLNSVSTLFKIAA